MFTFDHIAIAAENLANGVHYLEDSLGVKMAPGGEHVLMSTHNRLLGLLDGLYLEVIAINPDAPDPGRPRWFDLDNFQGAPRITNWILRCDDLAASLATLPIRAGVALALSRGDLRWQMAVPADGKLPYDNMAPALIEWEGDAHPANRLPQSGVRMTGFDIQHPEAEALKSLFSTTKGPALNFITGDARFTAHFETPHGPRSLS